MAPHFFHRISFRTRSWRDPLAVLGSEPQLDCPAVLLPRQRWKLAKGAKDKEHAMSQQIETSKQKRMNLSQCVI
jgi:hypothetical protein